MCIRDSDSDVDRALDHLVRTRQQQWRIPGLSVGLTRDGAPIWSRHVGSARLGSAGSAASTPGTDATMFMIGSVTKTFTAALVMALRDDGLVDLDAPVGEYVPVSAHGRLTLRRLLSHSSGLQREPAGELWQTLQAPDVEGLLRDLPAAEQVLPPAFAFHYSNLAYACLLYTSRCV